MTPHTDYLADLLVLVLLVGFKFLDALTLRRRDRAHAESLDLRFANLRAVYDAGFAELRAYIVGPDGKNGMRSELERERERIDEMERRERDRADAAVYDRRRSV